MDCLSIKCTGTSFGTCSREISNTLRSVLVSLLLKAGVHFSDPISIEVIYYWNGSGSHQIRVWPRGINAAFQIMWLITVQSWFNERGQLLPHIESCSVGERWRALSPNDIII